MFLYRYLIALVFAVLSTMALCECLSADDATNDGLAGNSAENSAGDTTVSENALTESTAEPAGTPKQTKPKQTIPAVVPTKENAAPAAQAIQAAKERENAPNSDVVAAIQAGPRALSLAFRMAAKRATPSVVVLYSYGQDGSLDEKQEDGESEGELPLLERAEIPSPPATTDKMTGLGSGVIISQDGLIITNNHVISGASRVVVEFPDETRIDADVVRGDPDSDVAMLRVTPEQPLNAVEIGDSDQLEIGDWVLAIGSPFKLEATVSAGIISGKNRDIARIRRSSMLQTDAAINPGNSGGALIDLDGKVVGISTAIASRSGFYQGVGFAIPINQAIWIALELDQHEKVRRAAIGTTLVDLKPRIAKQFKLEPNSGILVYQVIKNSVAEDAGIQAGDVIVEFSGKRVRDSASLQAEIERKAIGSKQPILVRRQGELVELEVELAPADNPTAK